MSFGSTPYYVYRHPATLEWITGHFDCVHQHLSIPVRESLDLSAVDPVEPVAITYRVMRLERHTVIRHRSMGGGTIAEHVEMFAESEQIALDWANSLCRRPMQWASCFGEHSTGGPPLNVETLREAARTLNEQAPPITGRIDGPGLQALYDHLYHPQFREPDLLTNEDIVGRSSDAVDTHQYVECLAEERTEEDWDDWLEGSARRLKYTADERE